MRDHAEHHTIPVPAELLEDPDCDFDLVEYFQELVDMDLAPALDSVGITYSVTIDAYYGGGDQNYSGTDERHLIGTRSGNHWVFPPYIPRERRSTADEF